MERNFLQTYKRYLAIKLKVYKEINFGKDITSNNLRSQNIILFTSPNFAQSAMIKYATTAEKLLKYTKDTSQNFDKKEAKAIPASFGIKAILKNDIAKVLNNRGNVTLKASKTLHYLQSFDLYNNAKIFNEYTRQNVISWVKNKRTSHYEETDKFFNDQWNDINFEMHITMIIFQIGWEVCYNFLGKDCFEIL